MSRNDKKKLTMKKKTFRIFMVKIIQENV